jgi:hypothetical protein
VNVPDPVYIGGIHPGTGNLHVAEALQGTNALIGAAFVKKQEGSLLLGKFFFQFLKRMYGKNMHACLAMVLGAQRKQAGTVFSVTFVTQG